MKRIKKSLLTLLSVFTLFLLCTQGMQVKAASAPPAKSFYLDYLNTKNFKSASIEVNYEESGITSYEVGLYNASKKLVKTKICKSYASFSGLKKNRLYYYRVRGLDSGRVPVTGWSVYRAFTTMGVTPKLVSNASRTISFKAPKISGVKSYTLYLSDKSNTKGFKKVGTIKPGKTIKVSKFKGKAFVYYKDYYYKIVPNLKKKASTTDALIGYFYISRTYR